MIGDARSVKYAAEQVGFNYRRLYEHRAKDPEFAAAWKLAYEAGTDLLRDEIRRRGAEGFEEDVYYQGSVVGRVRRYSDQLLMFEAKRRDPEYRDNAKVEVTGRNGGPIEIEDRSSSLADVARVLEAAGALVSLGLGVPVVEGEVADPRELLPAPPDR